jgi:putative flippase GtrA
MASIATRRSVEALLFGLIGASGLAVNQAAFAALTEVGGVHYLLAAMAATQVSSLWNFLWTDRWVFGDRSPRQGRAHRLVAYLALNNATLFLRVPLLALLSEVAGLHYLWSNLITLLVFFVVRFVIADGWIWTVADASEQRVGTALGSDTLAARLKRSRSADPRTAPRAPPFRYSIAGLLRIESQIELRELRYFLGDDGATPDIRITLSRVGALPSRRIRFLHDGEVMSYVEQLGAAGANFRMVMGSPIEIHVAPLLARSPHVLYTNVVEALLRFLLVSRGYVLLHSACIAADGRAALLSAPTDTGKTSTVIRLIREHDYQFLSDDMTIVDPAGRAICYPKPMTLSYHTMSAIRNGEVPARERAKLAVRSRLHSKSGRRVGRWLGQRNVPIMSINSVVQSLVPPPKYHVTELIPCEIGADAPIGHVFLMERGPSAQSIVTLGDAVRQLIANTDDAYEFPPFATFAPHIRIGGDDYATLRSKEEALLRRALAGAQLWLVRVPGHEWADVLPSLLERPTVDTVDAMPIAEPESIGIGGRRPES